MDLGALGNLVRSLAYSLPELIVLSIGFALLMERRREHAARRLGLIGVIAMFVATLLRTALGLAQTIAFTRSGGVGDFEKIVQLFGSAMLLLDIVFCAGLLAVLLALRNATRWAPEHERSHQDDTAQP